MVKKILYNYWGHLSDKIGISSPDGNGSYGWSIIQEFLKRNWDVYCGPIDRDKKIVDAHKAEAFAAFSKDKRLKVYNSIKFQSLDETVNNLDILFLEWRFPTKDNQLPSDHKEYSPDLAIQNGLLNVYANNKVRLIIFDLDHKLTADDELKIRAMGFKDVTILETASFPKKYILPRKTVYIPFDFEDMEQFPTMVPNQNKHMVYIGNNYEREIDFNTKFIPYSNKNPNTTHLVGNWLNTKNKGFRDANTNIVYHDRIGFNEFHEKIKDAVCVPLLAKESYKDSGYMTMRLLESLLFGSIPIGFSDFRSIDMYLPKSLIVDMDNYEKSIDEVVGTLSRMAILNRIELRKKIISNLSKYHDASNFVDVMLEVKNG